MELLILVLGHCYKHTQRCRNSYPVLILAYRSTLVHVCIRTDMLLVAWFLSTEVLWWSWLHTHSGTHCSKDGGQRDTQGHCPADPHKEPTNMADISLTIYVIVMHYVMSDST